jgi:hypothetical protein
MRQLYLHIGLHKTGTSYLQKFLLDNRKLLATAGLELAPLQSGSNGAHHQFAAALTSKGPQTFLRDLDWTKAHNVLVSSEALSHAFRDLSLAHDLRREAANQNIRIIIILFLRRQDFLKESVFSEVVKTWYCGSILEENHYDYDFNLRLINLENAFGKENIRICLYRDNATTPLSGLLLEQLDLSLNPEKVTDVGRQNVRMHRRKTLFMSQVPKQNKKLTPLVLKIVKATRLIKDDGFTFLLSPQQRSDFLKKYIDGNVALMKRHALPEADWFADASPFEAEWVPAAPIRAQEYMGVLLQSLEDSKKF